MKMYSAVLAVFSLLLLAGCSNSLTGPSESASAGGVQASGEVTVAQSHASGLARGVQNFVAPLDSDQEVVPPGAEVESDATGVATFQYRPADGAIRFRVIVANIENVTMAHIHLAPRGENGPVVVWLYPEGPPPQVIEGRFSGILAEGVITQADLVGPLAGQSLDDLLALMQDGQTYVNVHTQQFGAGEIRGQIDRGNTIAR